MSDPSARQAIRKLLQRHDLDPQFPQQVLREVEAITQDPGIDDPRLDDLTALPFVTIDYERSRDLDQALHIARVNKGRARYLVRYALADAAYYVRPGSALFKQALRRGVSYYLPGLTVPMLPAELSEGIISLNPDVERRALVLSTTLDQQGAALRTTISRARIRSQAKLSYSGVQRFLDAPDRGPLAGQPFSDSLSLLQEVGELRMADARRRDVVYFNREEPAVVLSEDGKRLELRLDPRDDTNRYNEQISLLCNIEGARLLVKGREPKAHVQPVFRVHDPPMPEALDHLERVVDAVARLQELDPTTYRWRREAPRESLGDYLERLRGVGGDPRVMAAIERQALITNQRSVFSSEPGRHFALGVKPYSRFSAPMREIVGIFTHKEALEKLGLAQPGEDAADHKLREQVIAAANEGKQRQRRLDRDVLHLAIDGLLRRDLRRRRRQRPVHQGTILGLNSSRLYVRLDDPPVELKVYADDLSRVAGQSLELLEDDVLLGAAGGSPRYCLGDAIRLRAAGYDQRRRRFRLESVQ